MVQHRLLHILLMATSFSAMHQKSLCTTCMAKYAQAKQKLPHKSRLQRRSFARTFNT